MKPDLNLMINQIEFRKTIEIILPAITNFKLLFDKISLQDSDEFKKNNPKLVLITL